MKTKLSKAAFGVALISLSWCLGCQQQNASANESADSLAAVALSPLIAAAEPQALDAGPQELPPKPRLPLETQKDAATNAISSLKADAVADTNSVATPVIPAPLQLTPGLSEVVKLIQAGVGEEVLMTFITNSPGVFNIGSDEILYLHDIGTPAAVITTLIQQDIARKQAAATAKPLPPGVALTKPITNALPARTAQQELLPATVSDETAAVANAGPVPPEGEVDVVYATPIAPQAVSVTQFYTELAPYGTWVDVPGYGHCWRPTVAVWNSSWRPYGDGGRWLWTDSGWYWYSDYSWGWAPFHYGRWSCPSGIGWVWTPDTHWGPAWVSWRSTRSHCGWAPLPPAARFVAGHGFFHNDLSVSVSFDFGLSDDHYVFLPTSRFCDRRLSGHYLSRHHAAAVYRESTVVNNYVTVNKNTVINKGVGFERIASATRGNIRQVALRGTTEVRGTNLRRETLDSEGKTLTVVRPTLTSGAAAPAVRPVTPLPRSRTQREPAITSGTVTSTGEAVSGATTEGRSGGRRVTALQGRAPGATGTDVVTLPTTEPGSSQGPQALIRPRTARAGNQAVGPATVGQSASRLSAPAIGTSGATGAPVPDRSRPNRSGVRPTERLSQQVLRQPSPTPSTAVVPRPSPSSSTIVRPISPRSEPRAIQVQPAAPRGISRVPETAQPRYSAPSVPHVPSAPPSRPAPAPSPRVESYRPPSVPSAPSSPPPARSEGSSRSRPSNDDGGGRRGPR